MRSFQSSTILTKFYKESKYFSRKSNNFFLLKKYVGTLNIVKWIILLSWWLAMMLGHWTMWFVFSDFNLYIFEVIFWATWWSNFYLMFKTTPMEFLKFSCCHIKIQTKNHVFILSFKTEFDHDDSQLLL